MGILEKSYLSRALGMGEHLEIDYQSYPLEVGDTFVLMTDGVYEFAPEHFIADTIHRRHDDLDQSLPSDRGGSAAPRGGDNLSIQVVRIDALPEPVVAELHEQATTLPLPPPLRPRMAFEGYGSCASCTTATAVTFIWPLDRESRQRVALKVPSVELRGNPLYLERFLTEEWVARRLDNVHILKAVALTRKRHYLYTVTEYVEGQTLTQWMTDNPLPTLKPGTRHRRADRRGLQALHRQEMLHQDLRPNNVMIDRNGTVKLIDFGSVHGRASPNSRPPRSTGSCWAPCSTRRRSIFSGDWKQPVGYFSAGRHRLSNAVGAHPTAPRSPRPARGPRSAVWSIARYSTKNAPFRSGSTAPCARRFR